MNESEQNEVEQEPDECGVNDSRSVSDLESPRAHHVPGEVDRNERQSDHLIGVSPRIGRLDRFDVDIGVGIEEHPTALFAAFPVFFHHFPGESRLSSD